MPDTPQVATDAPDATDAEAGVATTNAGEEGTAPTARRSPGHRTMDVHETVAELTRRAHEISADANNQMASAMRDVIGAAAGFAAFAVESARDLVQFMVRRGQMTQTEADRLIHDAETAAAQRSPSGAAGAKASQNAPAEKSAARSRSTKAAARGTAPATKSARSSAKAAVKEPAKAAKATTKTAAKRPAKAATGKAKAPTKAAPAKATKSAAPKATKAAKPAKSAAKSAKSSAPKSGGAKRPSGKKR